MYFRSRAWFDVGQDKASPPTYEFLTEVDGDVVGYCAAAFRNYAHPSDRSELRRKYLVIYAIGVDLAFQGCRNTRAPQETYAESILGILYGFATDKNECVGLGLWVRANNTRAIAFYQKGGFIPDPHGPMQRDGGTPHLTMRKLLHPVASE